MRETGKRKRKKEAREGDPSNKIGDRDKHSRRIEKKKKEKRRRGVPPTYLLPPYPPTPIHPPISDP